MSGAQHRDGAWDPVARHVLEATARSRGLDRELRAAVLRLAGSLAGRRGLDLGCGAGALVRVLAARGARASGVDTDPAQIDRALADAREAGLLPSVRYRRAEPDQPREWPRGAFDLITWLAPSADPETRRRVLRAAARRLTRGGCLVIVFAHPSRDARSRSLEAVFAELRDAGLQVRDVAEPGPGPDALVVCAVPVAGRPTRRRRPG